MRHSQGAEPPFAAAAVEESTAQYYIRLFLRRKWIILACIVATPTLAVLYSLRQPSLYQASAKVWLKPGNLAATLAGIQDTSVWLDPARLAQTQTEIAQTRVVARRVLRRTGIKDRTPGQLLGSVAISAESAADILVFSIVDRDPRIAQRLANEYAHQYTVLRRQLDTASLNQALRQVLARIDALKKAKDPGSAGYLRSLNDKADQLRTFLALESANAVLARPAEGAGKVQPTPRRYGLLGLGLGVMLGIALAFLWDALDTRVRSAEEVGERLGLPLLARLHEPPPELQREDRLVMLSDPSSIEAEAFRVLRTNLEFVNLEQKARSIMITSALAQEGKSTTVANLAVAVARAGRRVVLVDLDLRRPYIDRFFRLGRTPGLTDVALGEASLADAIARVPLFASDGLNHAEGSNGHARVNEYLDVLPSGPIPPDAGEFVGTTAVARILEQLEHEYDLVLVDTPPLLHVGDGLTLATKIDAMVVLTRLPSVRRPVLKELHRVLVTCPGAKLGFALAGTGLADGYGYTYDYQYGGYAPEPERESKSRVRASAR